ncbi:hypothetical protein JOC47_000868 [Halanaerobacter jeridensis]|uniref:Uncharacterized protein n=1 Tax=Halanaerobacter jeridensis TaxID=706427 RepID=A0A938XQY1_9FIRM|nr:hypothetical protein [Halanaerobacter jeridensis]
MFKTRRLLVKRKVEKMGLHGVFFEFDFNCLTGQLFYC